MSRFALVTAVSIVLAAATLAPSAHARVPPVKGAVIVGQRPVGGQTGDCLCEWQWYTVGLSAGKVQIIAHMGEPRQTLAPVWSMRLVLMKGNSAVASANATCARSMSLCKATAKVNVRIAARGVYYIRIEGRAAHLIPYGLVVKGNIYKVK